MSLPLPSDQVSAETAALWLSPNTAAESASSVAPAVEQHSTLALAAPPPSLPAATPSKQRRQLWVALHFFNWSWHAALHGLSLEARQRLHDKPVVIVEADRQRRVIHCNELAWRQGIRAGHTLNAAIALCHQVQPLLRPVDQEAALLKSVAQWAEQYTPCVNMQNANELLLEVRGSLRLFGGAQKLLAHIQQELSQRQLQTGISLSSTARSALWLARDKPQIAMVLPRELKSRLGVLPLRCLHWPMEVESALSRFGVRSVADVLRLPRADLARRIGREWIQQLECALGRKPELHQLFIPSPRYRYRQLLDFEVTSTPLLEKFMEQGMHRLMNYLQQHDLALMQLQLLLVHREQHTPLRVGLSMQTADRRHLMLILHEHLQRLVLPAPVLEIHWHATRLLPARGIPLNLFGNEQRAHSPLQPAEKLARLLEQLQVRFGKHAVQRLKLQHDHRPECAQHAESASIKMPPASLPVPVGIRPLWMHEPYFLGEGAQPPAELQLIAGPERIESGWWQGTAIKRDYFVAEDCRRLCWIYCEQRSEQAGVMQWYRHGWFG